MRHIYVKYIYSTVPTTVNTNVLPLCKLSQIKLATATDINYLEKKYISDVLNLRVSFLIGRAWR